MIDKKFIESKLSHIQSCYSELEDVLGYTDADIRRDTIKLRALERIVQLIVDEIIDINNHIIRYARLNLPDSFQSSFLVLAENKILPDVFARKIAPVVGLRNRIVHRYEKTDMEILLRVVRENKEDFKEFIRYIIKFIEAV